MLFKNQSIDVFLCHIKCLQQQKSQLSINRQCYIIILPLLFYTCSQIKMKRQENLEKALKIISQSITRVWNSMDLNSNQTLINYNEIPQEYSRIISKLQSILSHFEDDRQKLRKSQLKNNKYEQFIKHISSYDSKYQFQKKVWYIDTEFQQKMQELISNFQVIRNIISRTMKNQFNEKGLPFTNLIAKALANMQTRLPNQKGQSDKLRQVNNILVKLSSNSLDDIQKYNQSLPTQTSRNISRLIEQIRSSSLKSQQIINKLNPYLNQTQSSKFRPLSSNLIVIQYKLQPFIKFVQQVSSLSIMKQSDQTNIFNISREIVRQSQQLRMDHEKLLKTYNATKMVYRELDQAWIKFEITPEVIIMREGELIKSIKSMKDKVKNYGQLQLQCRRKEEEIQRLNQTIMKNLSFKLMSTPLLQQNIRQKQLQNKYNQLEKEHIQLKHKHACLQNQQKQLKDQSQVHQLFAQQIRIVQGVIYKIIKEEKHINQLQNIKILSRLQQYILNIKKLIAGKNTNLILLQKQNKDLSNRLDALHQQKQFTFSHYKNIQQSAVNNEIQLKKKIKQLQKMVSQKQQTMLKLKNQRQSDQTHFKFEQTKSKQKQRLQQQNVLLKKKEKQQLNKMEEMKQQYSQIIKKKDEQINKLLKRINRFKQLIQEIKIKQLKKSLFSIKQSLNQIKMCTISFACRDEIQKFVQKLNKTYDSHRERYFNQANSQNARRNQQISRFQSQIKRIQGEKLIIETNNKILQKSLEKLNKQLLNQQVSKDLINKQLEFLKQQVQMKSYYINKENEQNSRNRKILDKKIASISQQLKVEKQNFIKMQYQYQKSLEYKDQQMMLLKNQMSQEINRLTFQLETIENEKKSFQFLLNGSIKQIQEVKKKLIQQKDTIITLNAQIKSYQKQNQYLKSEIDLFKTQVIQKQMMLRQIEEKKYQAEQQLYATKQRYNKQLQEYQSKQSSLKLRVNQQTSMSFEQQLKALKRQFNEQMHQKYSLMLQGIQQNPIYLLYIDQLFQGQILREHIEYKYRILFHLYSLNKKAIERTRMVYKLDLKNQTNFHEYIDDVSNLICVVRNKNNIYLASYYSGVYKDAVMSDPGMLISITTNQSYVLKKPDSRSRSTNRGMVYDPFFIIFGNSEIRIRFQESTMFSNFGIPNSYFQNRNKKVNDFLSMGNNVRDTDLVSYEIYEIIFEGEEREKEQSRTQY